MNYKLVKRYSGSLLEAASDEKSINKIYEDANSLIEIISSNKDLSQLLSSPVIKKEKKLSVINTLFKKKVNPLTFNILSILIKNGRENYTFDILKTFIDMVDEKNNIVKPVFTTSVSLTDKEKAKITKDLDKITHKTNKPLFAENKELIGGFTVRYDDRIYDASIRRQLENMKNTIKNKN